MTIKTAFYAYRVKRAKLHLSAATGQGMHYLICLSFSFLIFLLLNSSIAFSADDAAGAESQPAVIVFDWKKDKCDPDDSPDAPARAFRDLKGQIHVFATQIRNRQMIGPDFDHLRHDCAVAFVGKHSAKPADYDDYSWLTSFYTNDGNKIWSLVHNEFHGQEYPTLCPSRVFTRCWETSLVLAISEDGGSTFQRHGGVIAALPYTYQGDQEKQFGYFNPTNIVQYQGYYYAMSSLIDARDKTSGVCVMRTQNLDDTSSWRAWDGHGFNVQFFDPYRTIIHKPLEHICAPLPKETVFFSLGSIIRHQRSGLFVLTMRLQKYEKARDGQPPGVYITTSRDLVNWSTPQLLFPDSAIASGIDGQTAEFYPSLLDPKAKTLSFEDTSDHPYLFTIRTMPDMRLQNRQLIRRDIDLRPLIN